MFRELPRIVLAILFFPLVIANVRVYRNIFGPRLLHTTVLPAGKSHAVLIETPRGRTILIDTGSDASILRALGESLPPWQRRIDAVVLTARSKNAAGGLPEVESRYRVSNILRIGDAAIPYGARLMLDAVSATIITPGTLTIAYGVNFLEISSSTSAGTYTIR